MDSHRRSILAVAAMTLPDSPDQWPADYRDHLAERIAMMEADDVPDARRKAVACVRRMAGEQGELFDGGKV